MPASITRLGTRRRWLVGGLTILIMIAVVLVIYRTQFAGDSIADLAERVPLLSTYPVTIVPGIHMLGGLNPAAAYVVDTSAGLVLIDSGIDKDAALLLREMAELGLDWRRLHAILLTHAHADHSCGAGHLRDLTGAKIYAGEADAAILRAGAPREAFIGTFFMPEFTPFPTTVDVELKSPQTLSFGEVRFQVLPTPGHSPGSVCYLMQRNGLRVLFAGDVIVMLAGKPESRSRLDRPLGTYLAYKAPRYRGDARAFLSTLRTLRALPAPHLVLPGHPRMDPAPQNPAMSQERWEALLDPGIREMETLQARYENDGANFLDGIPKKLLPDLFYLGEFKDSAVYAFFASSKLFVVNAPGGSGLGDFVNARLKELGVKQSVPTTVLLTSCSPEATAGLGELVQTSHAQVVGGAAGQEAVKKLCPAGTDFLPAEDLAGKGWFRGSAIELAGRGVAPLAYQISFAGKTVLFSGRIPVKLNEETVTSMKKDFAQVRSAVTDFGASLDKLESLSPDLWLPALPADGQNANLYERDWEEIIQTNREYLRRYKEAILKQQGK